MNTPPVPISDTPISEGPISDTPISEGPSCGAGPESPGDEGQATAEYALVMLAAAALAGLLLAWATRSGGIERLLDAVIDSLIEQVG